jgi:quercetin dioxygenase-like cupin family protein
MKKILFLLLISVATYGQNSIKSTTVKPDTSSNTFVKGSLLKGHYTPINSETRVIKEIGNAKVIYKFFHTNDIMSAHTNQTDVLVTVILGKVNVKIQGQNNMLDEGDYICIPANAVHELTCIKEAKILIIK